MISHPGFEASNFRNDIGELISVKQVKTNLENQGRLGVCGCAMTCENSETCEIGCMQLHCVSNTVLRKLH